MKWEGPYRVKCPKCKGRNIWITEITEGDSQHFVRNGIWDHDYDVNEYGIITRTECKCDDCGHIWVKRLGTIDSFLKEN